MFGTPLSTYFKEAGISADSFDHSTEPQTLFVFTISRDDIVELTRRITKAIPPHLLKDIQRPLGVSVDGSFRSGKKIIADYALMSLFSPVGLVKGCMENDEYCDGIYDGQNITVSFINTAWPRTSFSFYGEDSYSLDTIRRAHKETRTNEAGIMFIHNDMEFQAAADLSIWLENDKKTLVNNERSRCQTKLDVRLKEHIDANNEKAREWPRYFEITVRHPDLLRSTQFMDELTALCMRPITDLQDKTPIFQAKPAQNPGPS